MFLLLLLFLPVEREDLINGLRSELPTQSGRFLAPELPVIRATHLVGPTVAIGDREPNLALGEGNLETCTVDAAGVHKRIGDAVTEDLLEPTHGESVTPDVPIRSRALRLREDLTPLVSHQPVVDLADPMPPRSVPRESATSKSVVIRYIYMVVQMPAHRVSVRDHDVGSRVKPLSELHP